MTKKDEDNPDYISIVLCSKGLGANYAKENQLKRHEYNEASANAAQARAYEMWEKTNYAAQIEQMKKANLSPGLMYGQAGAGGGTVSGAQGQGTSQPTDRSIEMKLKGQEMGLQLANLASQIKLNESQANKNNAEANKTAGVDTELAKTSIENLISQTKMKKTEMY